MTLRILNLYAGIGGNRKLWSGDIEVTAVELDPDIAKIYQDFFPQDKVIVGDAHQYLLDHYKEFDFIWTSPPCQTHSKMNRGTRHRIVRYPDMRLYQEIIFLRTWFKGSWVVENVEPYYEPLIEPQISDRHRFWANFRISNISISRPKFPGRKESVGSSWLHAKKPDIEKWLGIYLEKNVYMEGNHCECQVLRNCVHPKLGLHVFNCAFKSKQAQLLEVLQ